jgi:hypothetical protein
MRPRDRNTAALAAAQRILIPHPNQRAMPTRDMIASQWASRFRGGHVGAMQPPLWVGRRYPIRTV